MTNKQFHLSGWLAISVWVCFLSNIKQ